MRIRFGLCLLPVLFAGACTTDGRMADGVKTTKGPATATETFAMLPDSVGAVPSGPGEQPSARMASEAVTIGYVASGSMQIPATSNNPEVDRLISTYAANYEVPESLVRRVVKRESNFRPGARNGPYYGLMQILPATARSMGFEGTPSGLLDAETNLKYAVKYLKGAFMVAGGDHDQAVRNYSRGYYYEAKRRGMLGILDGVLVRKRTRDTNNVMVASAAGKAAAPVTPAKHIASQWETAFVTAKGTKTGASASGSAASGTLDARMGGSVQTVSAPASASMMGAGTGMGLASVGAASTPSLGISTSAE